MYPAFVAELLESDNVQLWIWCTKILNALGEQCPLGPGQPTGKLFDEGLALLHFARWWELPSRPRTVDEELLMRLSALRSSNEHNNYVGLSALDTDDLDVKMKERTAALNHMYIFFIQTLNS